MPWKVRLTEFNSTKKEKAVQIWSKSWCSSLALSALHAPSDVSILSLKEGISLLMESKSYESTFEASYVPSSFESVYSSTLVRAFD